MRAMPEKQNQEMRASVLIGRVSTMTTGNRNQQTDILHMPCLSINHKHGVQNNAIKK